ncbi:MAG: RecX family transcriptional regulator [Chitinophagales bacterium]|nr:RecX family transcriptional regulator [Chitinophagales bacterium]
MKDSKDKEKDLFNKLCRFCAYRERAVIEVKTKMQQLQIPYTLQAKMIEKLKEENFLNEERYAKIFAKGKQRNNQWGRNKIKYYLAQKKIKANAIQIALASLDGEPYTNTIEYIIHKKKNSYTYNNIFELKAKIAAYLQNKGFETDLIWEYLNKIILQ